MPTKVTSTKNKATDKTAKSKVEETKKSLAAKKAATDKKKATENEAKRIQNAIADNSFVELTLSWKNIQPIYRQQLKNMAQKLKLKGFRQGKTPLNVAEKEIGHEKLVNATLQQLLPAAYAQALKDNKKQPLTNPRFQGISLNKDNDWIIKAYFAEKPELKIKGYKKIIQASKKKAHKEIEKIEKKIKADAKKAKTAIKDKAPKNKKGQPAASTQPKELTQKQKEDMTIQMVFTNLVAELKPRVPELLIKQNTENELRNLVSRLKELNLTLDKYLEAQHSTREQLTSQLALSSLNKLQVEFLLTEIANQEKIEATQEDVDSRIKEVEDKKLRQQMTQDKNYQNYLRGMLVKQKVIKFLLNL